MSPALTIEDGLILACARTDPDVQRIRDLLARGPDWRAVLRKAGCWRLGPLVYASVQQAAETGEVPAAMIERLRHLSQRDTSQDVAQREMLHTILRRFSAASVPVIVLQRAGDIDLLVHRRDRDTAEALLRAERSSALRIRHHIAYGVSHRITIEDVWERARPVRIESVDTFVLGHEDLLVQLALDLTACLAQTNGRGRQVRILCDIGETCRRHGSAIDWSGLVARAAGYDVAKQLYYVLRLADYLVDAAVPSGALTDLRARFGRMPLEDQFVAAAARRAILSDDKDAGPSSPFAALAARLLAPRSGEVAVTYDPFTTDGVGSQLLRIYGLYALSRALHTKYVHTPLAEVSYQGFLPLLTGRTDPDFAARYNAFFSLPSDDFDLESCERVPIHILHGDLVERYREHTAATRRPVLLQAIHHYGYTDGHPAAFHALRVVSPYRAHRPAGPVRVCVHLRRGDNSVPGRADVEQRLLPNRYYLRVCGAVLEALHRQGAPFVVRLHSEVPLRRTTLSPDTPGLYFDLDEPATIDPSEYRLEEFHALPNLQMVLNVEAREALDDFATADVLILSRSSLGYLGGVLNPHGLVVYAPWWHPALPDWLVADERGNLNTAELATRIGDHLRCRSRSMENEMTAS